MFFNRFSYRLILILMETFNQFSTNIIIHICNKFLQEGEYNTKSRLVRNSREKIKGTQYVIIILVLCAFSVCCWLTEAIKPSPVIQWNFSLLFVALSSSYLVRIPMLVAFFSARVCWVRGDLSTAISALGYLTCFPRHNSTDVISPNLTRKEGAEREREREREKQNTLFLTFLKFRGLWLARYIPNNPFLQFCYIPQ